MYRPEFSKDADLWRQLIEACRKEGVSKALNMINGGAYEKQVEIDNDGKVIMTYNGSKPILSEQEAIEFFEVDTNKWEVVRLRHNAWDVTNKEGVKFTNYQTRIDLGLLRPSVERIKEDVLSVIAPIKIDPEPQGAARGEYSVEICVFDLHLGKVGFDPDTLALNWSIDQCRQAYKKVFTDLFTHIDAAQIKEFILPVGNDMVNIDSNAATTTKGTPQLSADLFQNLFRYAHQLVSEAIMGLSMIAPVYVYMVPGNHDYNTTFSIGEVLEARFANNARVIIDNRPIKLKTHRTGNVLIGYHHGDTGKKKDYHSLLSLECPIEFGSTRYRYLHLGHLHKNQKDVIVHTNYKDEAGGVEVEVCPSLSPVDEWHYNNLYIGNMRRSKSFIYHPEKGCVKEVYAMI